MACSHPLPGDTNRDLHRRASEDGRRREAHDAGSDSGSVSDHRCESSGATFRVEFRMVGGAEVTWYQDGSSRLRLDSKDPDFAGTGRSRTFISSGSETYSCREPGICGRGTELFDEGEQQDLEGLGVLLIVPFHQLSGEAASEEPLGFEIVRTSDEIAGVLANCYAYNGVDLCLDDVGTPLRLKWPTTKEGAMRLSFEATSVSHEVSASDFQPPYPLEAP